MQKMIGGKKRKWVEVRRRKKEELGRANTAEKTKDCTKLSKMQILR